jgi:hypothetical protein
MNLKNIKKIILELMKKQMQQENYLLNNDEKRKLNEQLKIQRMEYMLLFIVLNI